MDRGGVPVLAPRGDDALFIEPECYFARIVPADELFENPADHRGLVLNDDELAGLALYRRISISFPTRMTSVTARNVMADWEFNSDNEQDEQDTEGALAIRSSPLSDQQGETP